jgi:hypothetical protein
MTAQAPGSFASARQDPEWWGHIAGSAIGANLANGALADEFELLYWREAPKEVDFVLRKGNQLIALKVKAKNRPMTLPGIAAFDRIYAPQKKLLVGTGGIPLRRVS